MTRGARLHVSRSIVSVVRQHNFDWKCPSCVDDHLVAPSTIHTIERSCHEITSSIDPFRCSRK